MTKLSRRGFLGSLAGSSAGFLTAVTLPKAAFAADQAPQKWDQTVDLLVVGAGGAGLASAVSAAQHGVKNIVVLEKMPFFGGNTSIPAAALTLSTLSDRENKKSKTLRNFTLGRLLLAVTVVPILSS